MVYRPPYAWYVDPPTHGILTPLPMVYQPPLSMIYRPPYPWYIDPPIHGILTPLPMEYRPPPTYGIMNSSLLVEMRGGSKYNDKKIDPGVKIPYGKFTMGFKKHHI